MEYSVIELGFEPKTCILVSGTGLNLYSFLPGYAEEVVEEFCIHVWVFLPHLNKIVLETLEEEKGERKRRMERGEDLGSPDI